MIRLWKQRCPTFQNRFARFRLRNFDLNDNDLYGRPAEADDEELQEIFEEDSRKSTRELTIELAVSHTTFGTEKSVRTNSEG